MRMLIFAFVPVLLGMNAYSQIQISGKITDERKNPLTGVQVKINDNESFTDSSGYLHFPSLKKGTYVFHLFLDGFNEKIEEVKAHQNQILHFTLSRNILEIGRASCRERV